MTLKDFIDNVKHYNWLHPGKAITIKIQGDVYTLGMYQIIPMKGGYALRNLVTNVETNFVYEHNLVQTLILCLTK